MGELNRHTATDAPGRSPSWESRPAEQPNRQLCGQTVFRQFCGVCGSPVLTDTERAREQGIIFVKAGTFDEVADLKPTTHYWVKRAHAWLPLPDDATLLMQE